MSRAQHSHNERGARDLSLPLPFPFPHAGRRSDAAPTSCVAQRARPPRSRSITRTQSRAGSRGAGTQGRPEVKGEKPCPGRRCEAAPGAPGTGHPGAAGSAGATAGARAGSPTEKARGAGCSIAKRAFPQVCFRAPAVPLRRDERSEAQDKGGESRLPDVQLPRCACAGQTSGSPKHALQQRACANEVWTAQAPATAD